jgi:hypothetical protein
VAVSLAAGVAEGALDQRRGVGEAAGAGEAGRLGHGVLELLGLHGAAFLLLGV